MGRFFFFLYCHIYSLLDDHRSMPVKGRFLLFQVYRNFDNLFFRLSTSTFYKEISKFQQKLQS